MKKFLQIIFLCGLILGVRALSVSAAVQGRKTVLKSFRFHGLNHVSKSKVEIWSGFKNGDMLTEKIVSDRCAKTLQHFRDAGFYFAGIDSISYHYDKDSTQAELDIFFDEGNLLSVQDFQIDGLPQENETLIADLQTRRDEPFSPVKLETDIELILDFFEESGYPFCQVRVKKLDLIKGEQPGLAIWLQVKTGQQVTIDQIEVHGNELTKANVILREIGTHVGEIYDQRKIDNIRPKLEKLELFKWVNPPKLVVSEGGKGKLVIELAEGNYNRFDGVAGYNPGTATESGFLTGFLNFSFGNLFGTARQVDARWERRTEKTQNLYFRYLEPWVGGIPLRASFHFQQLIRDTSYVERGVGLELRYFYNDRFSLFSEVSSRIISPDSLGALRLGVQPSSAVNFKVGFSFNTLDNYLNPTKGVQYQTAFAWSRKKIKTNAGRENSELPGNVNQKRISIDFESYFSLFKWQVLAVSLHGRKITSGEAVVPLSDQYRFGGALTLRGYREDQFRGTSIGWGNFEYRYLLGPLSRFFLFLDVGYFSLDKLQNNSKVSVSDSKVGYGFGLRLDTKLGLLGIDYGLGEGDGFSNGKIHIGVKNEF